LAKKEVSSGWGAYAMILTSGTFLPVRHKGNVPDRSERQKVAKQKGRGLG